MFLHNPCLHVTDISKLNQKSYNGVILIKSTIPPGSCDFYLSKYKLNIVFNPEFLRESTTPNEDFENQDTIVFGTRDQQTYDLVKKLFQT